MNKKLKILMLEDVPEDSELIEHALKREKISFVSYLTDNKEDFIKGLREFEPDLILSDFSLPQFNGLEALELVKEITPETPFIMVTGSINEETAVECMKRGAWDYVIKENLTRLGYAVLNVLKLKEENDKIKIAEIELRKLSTAISQSPSSFVITDIDGNIEYVNPYFTKQTGYSKEEVLGCNSNMMQSGLTPTETYTMLWKTILAGNTWEGEFVNKKKNGNHFWESAIITPVKNDENKITNFIAIKNDITKRKKNEQLQKILYNISNAVITTDSLEKLIGQIQKELGTIIDTSNFFIVFCDFETDTLVSPFFVDEKDKFSTVPACKTLSKYVIETKKPLLANIHTKKELVKRGKIEHVGSLSKVWLGVPLKIKDKVSGVLAVQSYTDENAYTESDMEMLEFISEQISISIDRKKGEEELKSALKKATESDRLKTAFLNNFSHEIRTPMNGILGFVGLLKEPGLSGGQQQEFIKIIETSSERMLATVDDLVNISMIESGQVKVTFSEVNVNEQTEDIHRLLKQDAEKKGLKLVLKNSLPVYAANIKTDSSKIYSILTNIVKNAIKFSHKGIVEFGYNIIDKNIEFFITDMGIGIPKDRQEAIFERFVKADIEDKAVFEGSGLGLAIAKAYVDMLDGSIWVESEEGVGSTFYFTIPYNPVKDVLIERKVDSLDTNSGSLSKKHTILIVEDEEVSAAFLNAILSKTDVTILHVKTGIEAVEIVRHNSNIDIILMDIKLPVMSGYETVRQIRSFNKDVIIIAQTAYALKGDREKTIEVGCDDYISKPINKDKLIEMIEKWITLHVK